MCPPAAAVAASLGSTPASTPSSAAASATLRAIGPAVSCVGEVGMVPPGETRPSVRLIPTSELAPEGQTIEPSVSEPAPTAAKFADIAAPVPELDPHALRSRAYGFFTS